MGLSTFYYSTEFASALLCVTLSWIFHSCSAYGLVSYVFLGLAVYQLYNLFVPKRLQDGEKFNVVVIGAGMSGLNAARRLKELGIPFKVYEKGSQLGGTWWFNQYPGAACDVASHLYSLACYMNPWWTRAYSRGGEIENYLFDFAKKFDLLKYIKFNTKVTSIDWIEAKQVWKVITADGVTQEFNFVISCVGALHAPLKPDFKNQDKFQGQIVHTAEWSNAIDLKGKRVAIIGTGASAVQVVPNIAADVKELFVFQRTPCWVPPREDYTFPRWLQTAFSVFPPLMLILRWYIFWRGEFRFQIVFHKDRTFFSNFVQNMLAKGMKKVVKDPELAEKLVPKYPLGCKRITPSDTYLKAFNLPHVKLVTDAIDEFTASGIRTKDSSGKSYDVDVVILATGFSVMESCKTFTATGKGGKVLHEIWKDEPRLYLGTAHPGFPNLFFLLGPGTGLGHNSIIYVIECQTNYVIDAIEKLVKAGSKSMDCKKDKFDAYQDMMSEMMKFRVFRGGGGCTAWYQNSRGINWTLWPGGLTHFWRQTLACDMEDYVTKS